MSAASRDISIEQGADFNWELTLEDATPEPLDLTGCSLSGMIRAGGPRGKKMVDFTLTLNNPATDGKINVFIPGAETAAMIVDDDHSYDIFLTYPDLSVRRVVAGAVTVLARTTYA
jgi:hypothetical protein